MRHHRNPGTVTPAHQDAKPISPLDLRFTGYGGTASLTTFGPVNCGFVIDVEKTGSGNGFEEGTFRIYHPTPGDPVCTANVLNGTYRVTCTTLTLTDPSGLTVYSHCPAGQFWCASEGTYFAQCLPSSTTVCPNGR